MDVRIFVEDELISVQVVQHKEYPTGDSKEISKQIVLNSMTQEIPSWVWFDSNRLYDVFWVLLNKQCLIAIDNLWDITFDSFTTRI